MDMIMRREVRDHHVNCEDSDRRAWQGRHAGAVSETMAPAATQARCVY